MDGTPWSQWPRGVGSLLGLAFLLSLLSFHLQDPTITNLRQPADGIGNWLGLPGALLGGSLRELLGPSALAVPLLWLNWVFCTRGRPAGLAYAGWSACLLLALAGLHGLVAPAGAGLLDAGLLGWSVRYWAGLTTGVWAGAVLLAGVALYAANHALYAPPIRKAARDARLFAKWFLRSGWRQGDAALAAARTRGARLQRVSGAAALHLSGRTRLGLRELLRLALRPPRIALGWLSEWRSPSLARIKSRSLERAAAGGPAGSEAGAAWAAGSGDAGDELDAWLGAGGAQHLAGPIDAEAPPPRAAASAPSTPPALPLASASLEPPALASGAPLARATVPPVPPVAPVAPWRRTPPRLPDELEPEAEATPEATAGQELAPPAAPGQTDYEFERPEAEAAWRERFQRYARNLDLDWEEQLSRRNEDAAPEPESESETDADS